jgi:hypothetical protein
LSEVSPKLEPENGTQWLCSDSGGNGIGIAKTEINSHRISCMFGHKTINLSVPLMRSVNGIPFSGQVIGQTLHNKCNDMSNEVFLQQSDAFFGRMTNTCMHCMFVCCGVCLSQTHHSYSNSLFELILCVVVLYHKKNTKNFIPIFSLNANTLSLDD